MTLLKMLSISFTHTHHIPCLTPPWGQNLYPKDYEIHNFGRHIPALHHHAFRSSYIHVVSEEDFFKNWSILTLFAPPHGPQESRKPEIHNLCPPCPKDTSYQI
jgi:hypothetical protein